MPESDPDDDEDRMNVHSSKLPDSAIRPDSTGTQITVTGQQLTAKCDIRGRRSGVVEGSGPLGAYCKITFLD